MDSTKVFIDTDNEITFILEKILSAKSDRVSLVIPDRASVFSSITGLKLLKRVVDKSNKLLVLVTLDAQGAELSRNAGLLVVSRVGEIHETIWERAVKEKFVIKKKDARTHYMPEVSNEEMQKKSSPIEIVEDPEVIEKENENYVETDIFDDSEIKDDQTEKVSLEESIDTPEFTPLNLDESGVSDVPQVRINIDVKELEKKQIEDHEQEEIVEHTINEENPPAFLSRETIKESNQHIPEPDDEVEDIESSVHNDADMESELDNPRIRKVAPKGSGITNLSFSMGKDVELEKKK